MSEHSFDKYVRDKLSNYTSPVPNGLWEKIAQEKKRKPAAFWWNSKAFLMLGLLFTTLAIGGFMLFQKQQVLNKQKIDAKSVILSENSNGISVLDETKSKNNNLLKDQENTIEKTVDKNIAATSASINQTKKATKPNNSKEAELNFSTNPENLMPDDNVLTTYNLTNSVLKKGSTTLKTIEYNKANSLFKNLNSIRKEEKIENFYFSKASLQPISLKTPIVSEKNANGLQVNLFKPKDCPEVNGNYRNDWYLEVYTSPDYIIKKVTGSDNNAAFLAKKDSSETMKGGFTFGARLTKNLNDNFLLKAGIQFSQLNEQLSLLRENERRVITVVTIKTVTDAGGNVSTVSDTSTVIQIGYVESKSYNYYRNIELPITLSYEMGNKNFKTAINAGVVINLASWYKGKVLDTSFQMVNVNPKENDGITKHSVGLSLYGSISFIKPINERADIFAEPYFRYSLSKLQNTAYNFSQRFSALGLTLGIRYKLNYRKQHY